MVQEIISTKPVKNTYYSDGKDYSNFETNSNLYPNHRCVNCGGINITITDIKDICHDCGYIYC